MYKSAVRVVIAALFSWLLVVAPAFADLTGDLSGTVTDSTGATVNGARVTIQNLNTGQTRVITTGESGEFSAPQLEIGNYRVTVEKDGFKSFSQDAVVRIGEKTRVDVGMQLGNVSESVVHTSGACHWTYGRRRTRLGAGRPVRPPVVCANRTHPVPVFGVAWRSSSGEAWKR